MRASATPRVSILMPARDASATLGGCLRSLARQTEPSWECVLVDDGSSDGTREIAERAAAGDPRIVVVASPPRGLIDALNTGLPLCRAPVIARMDADDLMHPARLATQLSMLDRDPTLAAVGCHVRIFPRARVSARLAEYEAWLNSLSSAADIARDAFVECPIAHPTLMARRDALAGGYADRGWPEDYDLILRMLARGDRIGIAPRRLLHWRDRPLRLSRTDERYSQAAFTRCKAVYLAGGFLRDPDYVLWGYGATGRALHRALAACGRRATHIVELHPGRIGQRIHGADVIRPAALSDLPGTRIVVSVARKGPRGEIRQALAATGRTEGTDFVCAA